MQRWGFSIRDDKICMRLWNPRLSLLPQFPKKFNQLKTNIKTICNGNTEHIFYINILFGEAVATTRTTKIILMCDNHIIVCNQKD